MNLRRWIRKLKYFFSSKKDIIYPDLMNGYYPEQFFNNDTIVTIIKYDEFKDTFIILIKPNKTKVTEM
jgi:hypothetical protein